MSLTNKIIANIKKTNVDIDSYINSENVICIDTSKNRIGVNTKNPRYSIDIIGETSYNAINSYDLHINNLASIKEISCSKIDVSDIQIKSFDASYGNIFDISCGNIYSDFVKVGEISTNNIYIPEISTDNINCISFNTLSADISNIKVVNLEVDANGTFSIPEQTSQRLNITGVANLNTISNEFLKSNEISCNKVNIIDHAFINDACFNTLNIGNLGTFTTLTGTTINSTNIDTDDLTSNDILCNNTLKVDNIINDDNEFIIKNGKLNIESEDAIEFKNLNVSEKLNAKNLDAEYINISKKIDISNATYGLILPTYIGNTNQEVSGNFVYDYTNNILKLYNNSIWNNLFPKVNYAMFDLCRNYTGNDISYSVYNNVYRYYINDSSNLLIHGQNQTYYKYIPINIKNSINNNGNNSNSIYFKENDPSYDMIKIDNCGNITGSNGNANYEINANICLQFLNRIPNDVEPNSYQFGIYSNINSTFDTYVETKNNIIVFDNSYNFSSCSLNYIGPLKSGSQGFSFCITTNKDLNYLVIENFNCSIKLLNY